MDNYNKLFQLKKPIKIPYIMWEDWVLTNQGLIPPKDFINSEILTPSRIHLLYWKSAFYDRGNRIKYKY